MPPIGYRAPSRKTTKISIPVEEDLADKLQALAVNKDMKRTELCRRFLVQGLEAEVSK